MKNAHSEQTWNLALSNIPFKAVGWNKGIEPNRDTFANDVATAFARVMFERIAAEGMLASTEAHKCNQDRAQALLQPYVDALTASRDLLSKAVSAASFGKHRVVKHKARLSLKHKCNDACRLAVGSVCQCSCFGVHHGTGLGPSYL